MSDLSFSFRSSDTVNITSCQTKSHRIKMPAIGDVDNFKLPRAKVAAVTRTFNSIQALMEDDDDYSLVARKFRDLEARISAFMHAVEELRALEGVSEERLNQLDAYVVEKMRIFDDYKQDVRVWMEVNEPKEDDVRPSDSVSNVSQRTVLSNTSSVLKLRLEAAQTRAKLQIEKDFREESRRLEEEEVQRRREAEDRRRAEEDKDRDLRRRKEDLELQAKLRMQLALDEVLDEHNVQGSHASGSVAAKSDSAQAIARRPPTSSPNPHPIRESATLASILEEQVKTTRMLAAAQERSTLPRKEPECFDGNDITLFRPFVQAFRRTICTKTSDASDHLYYLDQFTKGEARDIVRSCSHMEPSQGFAKAMDLLERKYGNEYRIADAFVQKLDHWPSMKTEDGKTLEKLSVFLSSCQVFMKDIGALNQLNSPKEIQRIVHKLPISLQKVWRSKSYDLMSETGSVSFLDLVRFVQRQADILTNPIFGEINDGHQDVVTRNRREKDKPSFGNRDRSLTCVTSITERSTPSTNSCQYCKKDNHSINNCHFFAKKSFEDRSDFIKKLNLCFGCLGSSH